MSSDHTVYDLGEVGVRRSEPNPARRTSGPSLFTPRKQSQGHRKTAPGPRRRGGRQPASALTGSLSLLFPGVGQMVAGEPVWGAFIISTIGFAAAGSWAILATHDRLLATFDLLGVPFALLLGALVALYSAAGLAHVGGTVHAHALGDYDVYSRGPHPVAAAAASALLPGWGQILNGTRIRAAMCLLAVWVIGAAALMLSPLGHPALDRLAAPLMGIIPPGWRLGVLLTAAGVVWCLAVYDAFAAAVSRRRQ